VKRRTKARTAKAAAVAARRTETTWTPLEGRPSSPFFLTSSLSPLAAFLVLYIPTTTVATVADWIKSLSSCPSLRNCVIPVMRSCRK
jgi:hypothetical protein